ncbi:unk domain protein, partial [Escherichia coli DEC6D]
MPEIKGTVTEDLVKQALYSGEVNKLLKAQVRKDFEAQIDTYVDEVLEKLIGPAAAASDADNEPKTDAQPEQTRTGSARN